MHLFQVVARLRAERPGLNSREGQW